jgi:hypothetical protein
MTKTAKAQSAERKEQRAEYNTDNPGFQNSISAKSCFRLTSKYSTIPLFHHSILSLSNCRIVEFFHSSTIPFFSRRSGISANASTFQHSNIPLFQHSIVELSNCRIVEFFHSSTPNKN